jgi:hypothetical protein
MMMSDQERIEVMKDYIQYLEARLLHSDKMHFHAMEMVRKLIGKLR